MNGRVMQSAAVVLNQIDLQEVLPRRIGQLVATEGMLLEAEGFVEPIGANVRIAMKSGGCVRGEVIGFRGQRSLILPFERDAQFSVGLHVEPDGVGGLAACGNGLLGRVIDAHGVPLDGLGPIARQSVCSLSGQTANPLDRGRITNRLDVGVRSINALLTVGEGQRVAVIAGSGVGKSVLMGQMLAGTDCDVIVIGLIGERAREVSDFIETKLTAAIRPRAVVVAVPADHSPLLRLRAAMRATALAEYFSSQGKKVLLMIDSLTRVAHAQREIGLCLGEPPTMKGYPPSALGLIPKLVERAGVNRISGGSVTAIYTVLADGGDIDDPIVDAARAIVDGHIVLSRAMAEQGIYPAIDISRSLSRTMPDVVDQRHADAAANFRRMWSIYEESRDLVLMGAYTPGIDIAVDQAMARHHAMTVFLRQAAQSTIGFTVARDELVTEFSQ